MNDHDMWSGFCTEYVLEKNVQIQFRNFPSL